MICIKCKKEIPDGSAYCNLCGRKQTAATRKALRRANGTGSVYKLSGRRSRPWVAAKQNTIIGYYPTKTDALEALGRLVGKDISERYNMTFTDVYDSWKTEHFKEIGVKGVESYETAYKMLAPLHARRFRDLRSSDYMTVFDAHKHKSRSTLSKYKQLLTQMSAWAMREDIITTNYARFIKLPEAAKKEKDIFTDVEIEKLRNDNSDAAKIVLMLIYTGMRIGELFSLPLVDYHGNYVIGGEKTAAGRNRVIPIRKEGQAYFEYFAGIATGDLLLSGYSGQRVIENFRNRDYYPLLQRLGITRKTPHCTRHTFASWARRSDIRPEILQRILGHASYQTTANIYVHTDINELVKAVDI